MGTPLPPPPKGHRPPIFGPYLLRTNGCMDQDVTGMELGLGPGDSVLDGDPVALPQKGGGSPKFSAHVYCDQTAGWMKLVLGMEVSLSPADFVLDGDPVPSPKRGRSPPPQIFGPFLLWPKGWMDQDGTCQEGGPWSTPHCARWGPSSPP